MMVQSNTAIDLVYTWVDGADPAWQAEKARYAHEAGYYLGNRNCRWQDNEELRYSLLSVAAYWPFEGTIYIVTAGQTPAWLNTGHPRIQLVDHCDILPDNVLPTFSSQAIEAGLHHIAGLSERFIYMNDDVFLLRPVTERDFYENGRVVYYVDDRQVTDQQQVSDAVHADTNGTVFSKQFMHREYGVTQAFHLPEHAPRAMLRSALIELESTHPALFSEAMANRFRGVGGPVIVDLLYRWLDYRGLLSYRFNQNCYMENCSPDAAAHYQALRLARDTYLSLCINDTSDDMSERDYFPYQQQMQHFLASYFPEKSEFEWN